MNKQLQFSKFDEFIFKLKSLEAKPMFFTTTVSAWLTDTEWMSKSTYVLFLRQNVHYAFVFFFLYFYSCIAQYNWACLTWKSTIEIKSLLWVDETDFLPFFYEKLLHHFHKKGFFAFSLRKALLPSGVPISKSLIWFHLETDSQRERELNPGLLLSQLTPYHWPMRRSMKYALLPFQPERFCYLLYVTGVITFHMRQDSLPSLWDRSLYLLYETGVFTFRQDLGVFTFSMRQESLPSDRSLYLLYETGVFTFRQDLGVFTFSIIQESLPSDRSLYLQTGVFIFSMRQESLPSVWDRSLYLLYETGVSTFCMRQESLPSLWDRSLYLPYETGVFTLSMRHESLPSLWHRSLYLL